MRTGHKDAQFLFEQLGRAAGYGYRRSWTRALPTDGVWLLDESLCLGSELPIAALEVAVSEGPKALKGSLDILAEVSPSIGILCINEVEIRRGLIRKNVPHDQIIDRIGRLMMMAQERVARSQQRLAVWSYAQLEQRYRFNTGDSQPTLLSRLAS